MSVPERLGTQPYISFFRFVIGNAYSVMLLQQISFTIFGVCLIRIPSTSVAILFKDMSNRIKESASGNKSAQLVKEWKEKYLLIRDLVEDLSDFIGIYMFVFMSYSLAMFVSTLFTILCHALTTSRLTPPELYLNLYTLFRHLISMAAVVIASENIHLEVGWNDQAL